VIQALDILGTPYVTEDGQYFVVTDDENNRLGVYRVSFEFVPYF
jgi:hypothetical protein